MATGVPVLLGCGVLRREVRWLVEKNGWPLELDFLGSSLHVNLEALAQGLTRGLNRHAQDDVVVFYGACHPRLDAMLEAAGTFRTEGENCIEMLLGRERYWEELQAGTFFLLEDWVPRWDQVMRATFGDHPAATREIFRSSCRSILAVRTPCSGDFTQAAEAIGRQMDVPLRWLDVGLDALEAVLRQALERQRARRAE